MHIFIVARDQGVSDSLQNAFEDAGYSTSCWIDAQLVIVGLHQAETPVVVCLFHGGRDGLCDDVLNVAPSLPEHAYVVISTQPQKARRQWNTSTGRYIPVLAAPFDLDELMPVVTLAATTVSALTDVSGLIGLCGA